MTRNQLFSRFLYLGNVDRQVLSGKVHLTVHPVTKRIHPARILYLGNVDLQFREKLSFSVIQGRPL